MTSEIDTNRRSLTPCLDENGVDDETVNDNSKEIELSDISDEEESSWNQCNKSDDEPVEGKPNGSNTKEATFKKITRNARERNYRDNVRRKSGSRNFQYQPPYRRFENKRKEIERYSVRNIIASREFTISRSQSRSFSPRPRLDSAGSKHSHRTRSFTPKRDIYRRRSVSPAYYGSSRYRSPVRKHRIPSRHSRSSSSLDMESYRSSEETPRRSRSRHKAEKNCSVEKSSKRRRKNKSKERRKHKKSRSESKRHSSSSQSLSPEPARSATSQTRQIINAPSLPQENIKVILKNEDAAVKKSKKRDKKNRKDKAQRKDMKEKKSSKDPPGSEVSKEVFASGDNILISVCFNNNNNTSKTTTAKSKEDLPTEQLVTTHKTKTKKRQQPPPVVASPVSSASLEESEKCQRKHKRKKVRIKNQESSVPASKCSIPPKPLPPINTKRKSDVKPIAIIDLEKSPGKEITQSPKEIIVLSDSDGETKKRDGTSKDVIIIEDMIVKKNTTSRGANQMPAGNLTPLSTPPESQPVSTQPVLKFALKSKSNVLPFNLLHDKAEEIEEQDASASSNTNNVNNEAPKIHQLKEMLETAAMDKNDNRSISSDDDEVYDPFEPTKSGSISPITPPPPNDVSSSSDMQKNKIESPMEKSTIPIKEIPQIPAIGSEEHLISSSSISIWSRKELDKKIPATSNTPPLPPTFNAFSASSLQTVKQHVSLYDGIYGSDLKAVVSPTKPSIKPIEDKSASKMEHHDDEHTPYSPSSDGYNDFEPPPSTSVSHQPKNTFDSMKHGDMDAHNNDPGSSSSFTFSSNDDGPSKNVPLKLTASTLKTFNTLRSSGSHGLSFVNKNAFDNFLPTSQQVKSPLMKRQSSSSFLKTKMSRFTSSMNENGSPGMSRSYHHEIPKPTPAIDESMLDDEVPNSAVDLINRDRLLKKSLRIERVAEEVKLVLKPHYNKKNITKDEYKEILRKAVPKICHNKTGEINIQKIHALVEAYIKKFRYKRKSIGAGHVIASSI